MPRVRFSLSSASLVLAAAASLPGGIAHADPAPLGPRIISGSGTTESGRFKAAASGAVFELPNRAKFRVAPNAVLRVASASQTLQLSRGAPTTTWNFSLMSGRVDVEMPSSPHNAVLATIGKLNAVVTAGHVAVVAGHDQATVANLDGEVRTLLADHWQTVTVGSIATLSSDNPSATAKRGLPFPVLQDGQRLFLALTGAAPMRGFRWAPVPGSDRYELRVRRLSDGRVMDQRTAFQPELSDALTPVEPGKYAINLRSVDAHGLESSWSPDAELRVIGVVLPPGGYSNPEAIFLGVGQEVKFTNTSGLEMTYVGTGEYFPATRGVALHRNTPTVVGFRLPKTHDTVNARLEPRAVYADVRVGPKRAVWPRDAVSIDIQLRTRPGTEIPSFLRVVPQVTIGLEPVDVTFEREGNVLHAIVPASHLPGPWVLRVEVADQFGVPLGHDFLEVAQQPMSGAPARSVNAAKPLPDAGPKKEASRSPAQEPTVASSD